VYKTPHATSSTDIYAQATTTYGFPKEAEGLLTIGAASKILQRLMGKKESSLPADVIAPVLDLLGTTLPVFIAPDDLVLPALPSDVNIDFSNVPDAPIYIAPIMTLPDLPDIQDLVISAVIPTAPNLEDTSITFDESPPEYVKPSADLPAVPALGDGEGELPALTGIDWTFPTAPVSPDLSYADVTQIVDDIELPPDIVLPSFSIPEPPSLTWDYPAVPVQQTLDWADLETWIADEDAEMAAVRINAVGTQVQAYSGDVGAYANTINGIIAGNSGKIQTWANEWKTKASIYGAELSAATTKYQAESGGKQSIVGAQVAVRNSQVQEILQKAQATVNIYQAKIAVFKADTDAVISRNQGRITAWSNQWQTTLSKYTTEIQSKLSEYQLNIQNELNNFNKQLSTYQANLQVSTQNAQLSAGDDAQSLQKYQSDLQAFQATVNKEMAEFASNELQKEIGLFNANTQGSLTKYSADIQNEGADMGFRQNTYSQEIAKSLQTYQSETGYDLGKYGSQLGAETQKFQTGLTKALNVFKTSMDKHQAEVQQMAMNNQNRLAVYGADLQNHNAKVQKQAADYQWKLGMYQQLRQEYMQGLQLFAGSKDDIRNLEQQSRR
jgi:hypothetical protein